MRGRVRVKVRGGGRVGVSLEQKLLHVGRVRVRARVRVRG